MLTETEVAAFLSDFKEKMMIWDVLFRHDRGKNVQALVALELRPIDRKKVLEDLDTKDYSEGPLQENCMVVRRCGCLAKLFGAKRYILKLPWVPWAVV